MSEGHPYRDFLNYAEKNQIDLISVGAHGAGFGMRALFGSNVDRVLRQAPCPVWARPLTRSFEHVGFLNHWIHMGEHKVEQQGDEKKAQAFMKAILEDLRALAFMLGKDRSRVA